jgi:hypothetical protein
MDTERKNEIYDKLLGISLNIEIKNVPDPRYINEKIGQCHILIEEVEKFYIEVSKEMSIIQRAFNNAIAGYENAKDNLISTDEEIKTLPSLKDREARANVLLKKELTEIKGHRNELSDLENLQKALNLKLKNLSRVNTDVKTQLKLMESQIRLGAPGIESSAARSLAEELKKSTMGMDVFNEAETTVEETSVVDPSEPLNVDELLSPQENILSLPNDLPIQEPETEPEKILESTPDQEEVSEERTLSEKLLDPMPTDPDDDISDCLVNEVATDDVDLSGTVVDLDKVLAPELSTPIGGEQKNVVEAEKLSTEPKQKEALKPKNPDEIDIDALLSQFK